MRTAEPSEEPQPCDDCDDPNTEICPWCWLCKNCAPNPCGDLCAWADTTTAQTVNGHPFTQAPCEGPCCNTDPVPPADEIGHGNTRRALPDLDDAAPIYTPPEHTPKTTMLARLKKAMTR